MGENIIRKEHQSFDEQLRNRNHRSNVFVFVRIGIVCAIFLLLAVYLLTPVSTLAVLELSGNIYLREEDICRILNKSAKTSLYRIDASECEELLNNHPLIRNATLDIGPFHLHIDLEEAAPGAFYKERVYNAFGICYEAEDFSSPLLAEYLETSVASAAEFFRDPQEKSAGYLSRFLSLVARVNASEFIIPFVDICDDDETFDFYFKVDSNFPYLRVKLSYESQFATAEYMHCLSKDVILETLRQMVAQGDAKRSVASCGGTDIEYCEASLSLIRGKSGVSAKFEYEKG